MERSPQCRPRPKLSPLSEGLWVQCTELLWGQHPAPAQKGPPHTQGTLGPATGVSDCDSSSASQWRPWLHLNELPLILSPLNRRGLFVQTQLLQLRALHEPSHVMAWKGFPSLGLSPAEQAASVALTGLCAEEELGGRGRVLSLQVCGSPSPHLPKSTGDRVPVSSGRTRVR